MYGVFLRKGILVVTCLVLGCILFLVLFRLGSSMLLLAWPGGKLGLVSEPVPLQGLELLDLLSGYGGGSCGEVCFLRPMISSTENSTDHGVVPLRRWELNNVICLKKQLRNSCQTLEGSCIQQSTSEQLPVFRSDYKSENRCPQHVQNEPGEMSDAVTGLVAEEQTQSVPKYILRLLGSSDRALRSRDNKPKPPEPINNVAETIERKKKKTRNEGINAQFSRIRAQLRYYLNRISYEQSLIDAYCVLLVNCWTTEMELHLAFYKLNGCKSITACVGILQALTLPTFMLLLNHTVRRPSLALYFSVLGCQAFCILYAKAALSTFNKITILIFLTGDVARLKLQKFIDFVVVDSDKGNEAEDNCLEESTEPYVGMEFDSEAARKFYVEHARWVGFVLRRYATSTFWNRWQDFCSLNWM
ncbi:transmembrane protein, putative [Medicago truncatula]|uniref:Transmembrane protein, putative n=1 Tax=Medicago truncatula TaxID=3880 RepID=A0A072TYE9_MEDTR|nr:transmembrane protein, putative [Medicago truncatula]